MSETPTRAVGYRRVSTTEQGSNGGGLDAQRDSIVREAERRGWQLVEVVDDVGVSGGTPVEERPGGSRVLAMLRDGRADVLLVSKLDRLTRSAAALAGFLEEGSRRRVRRRGNRGGSWVLVSCEQGGLDMTSPGGELLANMLGAVARWERRMISTRTSEALRAKQRQGVRLGRVPVMPDATRALVLRLYQKHASWSAVAHDLNRRGIETAAGGKVWHPSTVRSVVKAAERTVQPLRPETEKPSPRRRGARKPKGGPI